MYQALAPTYDPSLRMARVPASYRNPRKALSDSARPIIVDLEGGLLGSSLLKLGIGAVLRRNPLMIFAILFWCLQGRAALKRNVMAKARLNLAALPVETELLAYLQTQSAAGREIVLATTLCELTATQVLRRHSVFDRAVLFEASLERHGAERANRLLECFPRGFHYAGSVISDAPVWAATDHIILVNPSARVGRAARMQGRAITQFPQITAKGSGSRSASQPASEGHSLVSTGVAAAILTASVMLTGAQLFQPDSGSGLLSTVNFVIPLAAAAWLGNLMARRGK